MSEINHLRPNPRLRKIAELVPPNPCTADIGTDHAYVPIVLVEKGISGRAIASDVKKGPLRRAEENIAAHNLSDKIETRLGSGLSTLSEGEASVIVIAGMGGILISDIIEASRKVAHSAELLILQPMTAVMELRKYLSENNFFVEKEYLEAEEEKLYNILLVRPNKTFIYSQSQLYLGKNLKETSPNLFPRYREQVLRKLDRRAKGLLSSESAENKKLATEIKDIIISLKEEFQ